MPLDPQEERQKRNAIGARLALPAGFGWDCIFRVYQCRFHGLGDQATWDDLWRTLWARHLALPDSANLTDIRKTLSVCRNHGDPCSDLVHFGTLWGLGFTPEDALICKGYEEIVKAYKLDYKVWRWEAVGR